MSLNDSRFSLTADHLTHFKKHGRIAFDNLLSEPQAKSLQDAIEHVLQKRTGSSNCSGKEAFEYGFDLWKDSQILERFIRRPNLGQIASSLFEEEPIRIGYDQYFKTGNRIPSPFPTSTNLQEISCINPLAGAILFRLSPENEAIFSDERGSAVFLSPQHPIPWDMLFGETDSAFYLIAYANRRALYRLEPKDPHTHVWKKQGYVFGDRLKDTLNPLLKR